ncbi:MAG: flagellar hook-basal body complex protein [Clostridiales bacterium]|nr:flagellar hook-basal body complex protein [Clostridiales bacterium]
MQASMLRLGQSLLCHEKMMSVLADNVANADTPGFKSSAAVALSFDDALSQAVENAAGSEDARTLYFEMRTDVNMSQGDIVPTGSDRDLALAGSGFFCVQTADGILYRRSVHASVNAQGILADEAGNPILGVNGPIRVGGGAFSVGSGGAVVADGRVAGRLRLSDGAMVGRGDGYYEADGALAQADCAVMQGYAEMSNVDVTREYINMMSVSRAYGTISKTLTMIDEINGKAVSQIGAL